MATTLQRRAQALFDNGIIFFCLIDIDPDLGYHLTFDDIANHVLYSNSVVRFFRHSPSKDCYLCFPLDVFSWDEMNLIILYFKNKK